MKVRVLIIISTCFLEGKFVISTKILKFIYHWSQKSVKVINLTFKKTHKYVINEQYYYLHLSQWKIKNLKVHQLRTD